MHTFSAILLASFLMCGKEDQVFALAFVCLVDKGHMPISVLTG